jgi:hypothetical protein
MPSLLPFAGRESSPTQPRRLARFLPREARKMMLWDEETSGTSGNLQAHLIHHFFPDNQASSSSPSSSQRAVVGARKLNHPTHLAHHPRPEYSSASSTHDSGTASSAPLSSPMPPKRASSGSPSGTPAKLPKSETKPEDFSSSVKKRLQSSTRTGQACDRCKVGRPLSHPRRPS